MNLFRSALSACVVTGLKYTKLYLRPNDMSTTPSTPLSVARTTDVQPLITTAISSPTVRLPSITLWSLNQSLRNLSSGRIQPF